MKNGNKSFLKSIGSFFLAILIVMLIVAFLPSESEEAFFSSIFNKSFFGSVGSVGDQDISNSFFQLTKKSCIYRYENYSVSFNPEMIDDCAYDTAQSLLVTDKVSKKFGFDVSEKSMREDLSKQAEQSYKESLEQAGYTKEDLLAPEEIYKRMLRQLPLNYRLKEKKVSVFYNDFLMSSLEDTQSQIKIKEGLKDVLIELDLFYISSKILNNLADKRIDVSDKTIRKIYENELKTKKKSDKSIVSFEKRKQFLKKRKLFQERNKKIEEIKADLKSEIVKKPAVYSIKKIIGNNIKIIQFKKPLTDVFSLQVEKGKSVDISKNKLFLNDLLNSVDKKEKLLLKGPYKLEDSLAFVIFKQIITDQKTQNSKKEETTNSQQITLNENRNGFMIMGNVYQYIIKQFPIYRKEIYTQNRHTGNAHTP